MKKWTDHETHFNVNEHANETVDCDSSGSITWGHKYLVYVHDIYTYIIYKVYTTMLKDQLCISMGVWVVSGVNWIV